MNFSDKKILVCGMARSGVASARLLKKMGAEVTVQDIKEREKLGKWPDQLVSEGMSLYLGGNPDEVVADYDLVILSPVIPYALPFVTKAVQAGIPVWSEIELAYRNCVCPTVAITGTNGKTTTTALLGEIMKEIRPNAAVVGNIGVPFTSAVSELYEGDYAVAEVSSFQLEAIETFKPAVAAVLNITPDHLDRHKTLENYTAVKERIFEYQDENDYLILNYDDTRCRDMINRSKSRTYFFSKLERLETGVFLNGDNIHAKLLNIDEDILNVNEMKMPGGPNIENALAAVAMAVCAGAPPRNIRDAVLSFPGFEHRIEYVTEIGGVKFYNDSKGTNIDSAIKAIEAMKGPIVLIGGGYDKGSDFGDWVNAFPGRVKHLVVMGQVSGKIMDTCKAYSYSGYDKVNSLRDAVELAYSKTEAGDCVLLSPACASWDMFDNYEQRGNLFKEYVWELKEMVRNDRR